ncbi:MAG TPA: glycosyltransferase [Desulfuromonadales bacterium]|nr:glycosyltransferase [Desulfuromonadales bacterium]
MSLKPRVLVVCPGIGFVRRGYETSMAQNASIFQKSPDIVSLLLKGAGTESDVERVIPSIKRHWLKPVGRLCSAHTAYRLEQLSFFIAALQTVKKFSPDIIYISDELMAKMFYKYRRLLGGRYKIVFRNGAPQFPPFNFSDHIQQVSPVHYERAIELGETPERMTLLPEGFIIPEHLQNNISDQKKALREQLQLPTSRTIALVIGAVGDNFKRIPYIIDEFSQVPDRPYLVILGDRESAAVKIDKKIKTRLNNEAVIRTVAPELVIDYCRAADIFVHGALSEGFGRAIIEAASAGMPCLIHSAPAFHFLLGDFGIYGDFTRNGGLAATLNDFLAKPQFTDEKRLAQHRFVYERFSWDRLAPKYISMLKNVCPDG